MTRPRWPIVTLLALPLLAGAGPAASFAGEWRTSYGVVTLAQAGDAVTGTYGDAGQFTIAGAVDGAGALTFAYKEGGAAGDARWALDSSGRAFHGTFQVRGGPAGAWDGWRPDPRAPAGPRAALAGLWLTSLGLMELTVSGDRVDGRYAAGGTSAIGGALAGRRFEFALKSFRPGHGWVDVSADNAAFAGAAVTDGAGGWYAVDGRAAPEFARHAALVAGRAVDGSTDGLLTYTARAPDAYRAGDGKTWPAVVILHGSNMSGRAYVETLAAAWPDVARDYLLIGINGERPSAVGADPRFNYTYVSFVGRSTFKGFPGTDRESPALVAGAMAELRRAYPVARYFVGGHSQGGFLTYSLLMNYPELIAGAFAVSAGVIVQCEPGAYADGPLRAAQRAVPLAIVHGRQDPVVEFAAGEYAAGLFGDAGWPAVRFFVDDAGAGHQFARLPVGPAVRWLEAQSSDDPARLIAFAADRLAARGYRDAVAALARAGALGLSPAGRARLDALAREVDAAAAPGAKAFLPKLRDGRGGAWVDAFLAYRDDFEFAPAAREAVRAFDALRARHDGPARAALDAAAAAFGQGRRDDGYAKYQQIVDDYFAAPVYRAAKRWLADRP